MASEIAAMTMMMMITTLTLLVSFSPDMQAASTYLQPPLSKVAGRRRLSESLPDSSRPSHQQYFYSSSEAATTMHMTPEGQRRGQPRTFNNNDDHMILNDYGHEVQPLSPDTHTAKTETRSWPKRIRYDGEPFESIESLHQDPGRHHTYYAHQQQNQYNIKYDTLSGGIFIEDTEMQRPSSRTSTKTVIVKSNQKMMYDHRPRLTSTKNPAQSKPNNSHVDDQSKIRAKDSDDDGNDHGKKWSATKRNRRRPETPVHGKTKRKMSAGVTSPTVDDHYGGGFQQPTDTGILQNFYGKDFDYDNYELASRGSYGNRINQMTSRSDKHGKSPMKAYK